MLLALGGCASRPSQMAVSWGAMPVPPAGAYAESPAVLAADPMIVAQVRNCLAESGLQQGARPRYLVEIAYGVAPGRVSVEGSSHDEPQPVLIEGKPPKGWPRQEKLTLVVSDMTTGKDLMRTTLVRRKPAVNGQGQPAIGEALCAVMRRNHSTPH